MTYDEESFNLSRIATYNDIQLLMELLEGRRTTDEHVKSFIDGNSTIRDVLTIIANSHQIVNHFSQRANSSLQRLATEGDIQTVMKTLLNRETSQDHIDSLIRTKATVLDVIKIVLNSNDFIRSVLKTSKSPHLGSIDDFKYRIPEDLLVNKTEIKRVLLIGSCMLESWYNILVQEYPDTEFEYIIFNNASPLPPPIPDDRADYEFQLLQIPLRSIMPESTYFQLKASDYAGYEKLFQECCERLSRNLSAILGYHKERGLLSFIVNFHSIQQNPLGRMQGRYSLNNMRHFIDRLNMFLYEQVSALKGVHVVDFDEITNIFGKKYVNEDLVFVTSHGAVLVDINSRFDEARFEPLGSTTQLYGPQIEKYILTAFEEAKAMYRTIKQTDSVKLVIFDLDDTLWRGVAAEREDIGPDLTEGWPIGLIEVISYLWRRGILLAIVSKNDIENVTRVWNELYGSRFALDKFVKVAANWRPKVDNIIEILSAVNLLPGNVVFVDDNPTERAAVKAALPDIRILDAPLVSWRRILLWAPETQRAVITDEASERTDMVQAQMRREEAKNLLSRDEFLSTLSLEIFVAEVSTLNDKKFDRCFELINKTNQFNTTGVRWTIADVQKDFENGAYWICLDVRDAYTNYGLTGILIIHEHTINQFVLSCRVFGMEVETAAIAIAQSHIFSRGHDRASGVIIDTEKNKLSRSIFERTGFKLGEDGLWHKPRHAGVDFPRFIRLVDPFIE